MDANVNLLPTAAPTNTVKNSNSQQSDPKSDENQVTALPFQAILENQQPAPKAPETSPPSPHIANDEKALNQVLTKSKLAEADESTAKIPSIKDSAENAIDQLNFSRGLRPDRAQATLQAELLTGKQAPEEAWLANLKQSLTERIQTASTTNISAEKQPVLGAFTQKMQPLTDDIHDTTHSDDKRLASSVLSLDAEEDVPALGAFMKNEKEERRDQPLFPLDNTRDPRTKKLTEDFMPLNKKGLDKEPLSNLQAMATENISHNVKGAFTVQSETGALTASTTHQATTQSISMMPTLSATQAAAMNAPMAPPTLHLNSQLGSEAWQQQLSQQMLFFSRQGVSQAQIRLHPEELGSLNIHLRIEDNQAVMHFVSPHSHVRAAMESMMPVLRSALQESGIHLAQGSVGQDNLSNQSGSSNQNSHDHDGNITTTHPSVGAVGMSEANASVPIQNTASRQGGINTFA